MTNFTSFTHKYAQIFRELQNEQNETSQSEIYDNVVDDFYKEFKLPALWLDETGFAQGEADIDDMIDLSNHINRLYSESHEEYANLMNEYNTVVVPSVADCYIEEDNEYDYSEILSFLDNALQSRLEEAYKKHIASFEFDKLPTKEEVFDVFCVLAQDNISFKTSNAPEGWGELIDSNPHVFGENPDHETLYPILERFANEFMENTEEEE